MTKVYSWWTHGGIAIVGGIILALGKCFITNNGVMMLDYSCLINAVMLAGSYMAGVSMQKPNTVPIAPEDRKT